MHATTIAKIEAASRSVRINEAVALADLFGVSLDWLLGREPDDTTLTFAMVNVSSYAGTAGRQTLAAIRTAADLEDILEDAEQRFDSPHISELVRLAQEAAQHLGAAHEHYERMDSMAAKVIVAAGGESQK
jgi:hypothetical protein